MLRFAFGVGADGYSFFRRNYLGAVVRARSGLVSRRMGGQGAPGGAGGGAGLAWVMRWGDGRGLGAEPAGAALRGAGVGRKEAWRLRCARDDDGGGGTRTESRFGCAAADGVRVCAAGGGGRVPDCQRRRICSRRAKIRAKMAAIRASIRAFGDLDAILRPAPGGVGVARRLARWVASGGVSVSIRWYSNR